MADLHNLLDSIVDNAEEEEKEDDENDDDEEVEEVGERGKGEGEEVDNNDHNEEEEMIVVAAVNDNDNDNEGINDNNNDLEVPTALLEAARQRHHRGINEQQDDDENDDDDDDNNDEEEEEELKRENQEQDQKLHVETMLSQLPYTKLKQHWEQEWNTPDLLPYDIESMNTMSSALSVQDEWLDRLLNCDDDNENENDDEMVSSSSTGNVNLDALLSSIIRIDAERCKYLLGDTLRRRIHKLEEHPFYYYYYYYMEQQLRRNKQQSQQQQSQQQDEEFDEDNKIRKKPSLMSENEELFLNEYHELLERHFQRTIFDFFPQDKDAQILQQLHEPEMIDEPNFDTYVFCKTIQPITLQPTTTTSWKQEDDDDDDVVVHEQQQQQQQLTPSHHEANTCLIVRYDRIRHLVLEGKVRLMM